MGEKKEISRNFEGMTKKGHHKFWEMNCLGKKTAPQMFFFLCAAVSSA